MLIEFLPGDLIFRRLGNRIGTLVDLLFVGKLTEILWLELAYVD